MVVLMLRVHISSTSTIHRRHTAPQLTPPHRKPHALRHPLVQHVLIVPHWQLAVPAPALNIQHLTPTFGCNQCRLLLAGGKQAQRLSFAAVGTKALGESACSEVAVWV